MHLLLVFTLLAVSIVPTFQQQDDPYCLSVEAQNLTDCHSCVEITVLGGRPNCAYCANPLPGFVHCMSPFYPPALQVPGLTVFACYNLTTEWSGSGAAPVNYYKPRCAQKDCYIDQCLLSGVVLWYIIVPSVVGGVLLFGGCALYCWCAKRQKRANAAWVAKEERAETKAAQKRAEKSRARNQERKSKTDELRRKYGLLEDDEEEL